MPPVIYTYIYLKKETMLKTDIYRFNDAQQRYRRNNRNLINKRKLEKKQLLIDTNPEKYLLDRAKANASQKKEKCNLTIEDIVIPESCPLLDILMFFDMDNPRHDNTPSIDRIDPNKGYVKGNIWIISWKANRMKSDATLEELVTFSKNALSIYDSDI